MALLTDAEKERCRYHLGYMETSFAASLILGIPRPAQTIFLLEQALGLLTNPFACDRVRSILATLDQLETQIQGASCTLAAERVGEITLHPGRARGEYLPDLLEKEYGRWARRLADILGVPLYPYSQRFRGTGGARNVPVAE